jgi:type II secretory pathway component GspD/PulD (secretin)
MQISNVWAIDLGQQVEFHFTDGELASVLKRVSQLTGGSMVYVPTQVVDHVTVITPGEIPLIDALRLVQEALTLHGHAIFVLVPGQAQTISLGAAIDELSFPTASRKSIVLRNTNARRPRSRPCDCGADYPPLVLPYQPEVIIELER